MANINITAVDDALATIIAAQALGYLKSNTVLARLVARDWDSGCCQLRPCGQDPGSWLGERQCEGSRYRDHAQCPD
jgi:hypothetical protein